MDENALKDATAICGIDCFNCEFFHSNIDDFFARLPPEHQQAYAARGMTIEKLRCQGCRHGGCTVIGGACETRRWRSPFAHGSQSATTLLSTMRATARQVSTESPQVWQADFTGHIVSAAGPKDRAANNQ